MRTTSVNKVWEKSKLLTYNTASNSKQVSCGSNSSNPVNSCSCLLFLVNIQYDESKQQQGHSLIYSIGACDTCFGNRKVIELYTVFVLYCIFSTRCLVTTVQFYQQRDVNNSVFLCSAHKVKPFLMNRKSLSHAHTHTHTHTMKV